jgi:uncharacterized protein
LKLMESPWAYSAMVLTILVDMYLLYIFFTLQRATSKLSDSRRSIPT